MIRLRRGETVQVTRATRTGTDDTGPTSLPAIARSAFGKPQSIILDDDMRGRRTVIERNFWCPRDEPAGLQEGDRITRTNGEIYTVISEAFADVDHPMTGHNLGVKRHLVRRVSAPRG